MAGDGIDRRQFLGSTAAAAAWLAIHDVAASAQPQPQPDPPRPRLLSLELQMAAAVMPAMKAFYGKTLDLRLVNERTDRFTVEAGETKITFVSTSDSSDGRAPFYHFAFNIPENKILKALEWQKARTPMLSIPERLRTPGYPSEVADSRQWNAHSVFFLDPGGNVVEYIARHDLKNSDASPFSWADILYASEIGLVVDDVASAANAVKATAALDHYKAANADVTAIGDEWGMLLLMKRGRPFDFTDDDRNGARVYATSVNVRGAKAGTHTLAGFPYRLTIEERCSCA